MRTEVKTSVSVLVLEVELKLSNDGNNCRKLGGVVKEGQG
jgi:hypothetical protein